MVRSLARLSILGSVAVLLAACDVVDGRFLSPEGCTNREVVDATLHIDASDDRWIWAVDRATGGEISLRIPGGYGIQPDPPTVLDPNGVVIAKDGDHIVSGCRDIVQGAIMIDRLDVISADAS